MSSTHKRVLIVGGVAGGASCAARLRRMDEECEIIVFEKGPYISFANCGLPYHTGDVITDEAKLLLATPALFKNRFCIDVRVNAEVTAIDRDAKTIEVTNTQTGEITTEHYDTLVLSPGAEPIRPPIPGIDLPGIFTVRTVPDARAIRQWIESRNARRAVVVGGGFIGIEMAENLAHRGIAVTLIERMNQVMAPMDLEMIVPVHEHLRAKGVDLRLETEVTAFDTGTESPLVVRTKDGGAIEADMVIMSIGVRPMTALARGAGLEIGVRGGIRVNDRMQTSDPSIYAVGDAIEVRDTITGMWSLVPLAGPANRQGRLAADAIAGRDVKFRGVQGTAVCGCFELTMASTGLSEKALLKAGVPCEKVYLYPGNHVGYYPGAQQIYLKLLFRPSDGRILGAQAIGKAGVEKRIDVIAMAIQMHATVFDLEESELCYAPQYGAAKDPVNLAGFIAANHLRGDAPLVHWDEYLGGGEADSVFVLDVREPSEYAAGSVPGAVNIPLGQLRERIGELPKDREIYAHCGVGQRSHVAVCILRQKGFDANNLSGGFLQYKKAIAEK